MTSVIHTAKFHESLIYDLVELASKYGLAAEGEQFPVNPSVVGLFRRVAESTEGFPSEPVQELCRRIFGRDVWEKLPLHERRPGVVRRFTADRLELASLAD